MKNIILFAGIGVALVILYFYFFRGSPEEQNLVSSGSAPVVATSSGDVSASAEAGGALGADFLGLLLNVKHIKLSDSIFTSSAFLSLHDSSIILIQDGTEGRPNPFAPIGSDAEPVAAEPPISGDTSADGASY